jgi:L-methionine (R)-S-oxide reductase
MTSQEWLSEFLRAHGGVAGTVHRVVAADMMELDAAVNIPPPVQKATRQIPIGKGMAGIAMAEDRCVSTCNLQEDQSGAVKPGAKAVGAAAAVAFPVHDSAGNVRAVVGIAWKEERALGDDELRALQQAGEAMPSPLETTERVE